MDTKSVKAIEKYRIVVKWDGKYRTSPEYDTIEECTKAVVPFLKHNRCPRFLPVTFERIVRYVAAE